MKHFLQEFFGISGLVAWAIILLFIIANKIEDREKLVKYKKERKNTIEMYCLECQEMTIHDICGEGFNQSYVCKYCGEIN